MDEILWHRREPTENTSSWALGDSYLLKVTWQWLPV